MDTHQYMKQSTRVTAKVLELLLRHKGDVNCRANDRCTPLHLAASHGNEDCVRVLLLHNADISATDERGRSPIQVAESSSRHAVVKILRSAGKCVCSYKIFHEPYLW